MNVGNRPRADSKWRGSIFQLADFQRSKMIRNHPFDFLQTQYKIESMSDSYVLRELTILGVSVLFGLIVSIAVTPQRSASPPGVGVRLYQAILRSAPGFRSAADRKSSTYREQFLATFFLVAFGAFIVGIIAFGCSYKLGCK